MNDEVKANETSDEIAEEHKAPNFFQVLLSVAAGAFGVQTSSNHDRDFKNGSPLPFILAGVLFTVLFVLTIVTVVSFALPD